MKKIKWQCGSIENSYDVGMVLKRMRMAQEKTQEEVCIDEKGFSFLNVRQLSRIEKGENRPSTENFQFLTRKMGRELDWIMPMLETDKTLFTLLVCVNGKRLKIYWNN